MQFVGSRLQAHVDHRSRLPSVFGGRILLDVEFLNRVDGQNRRRVSGDSSAVNNRLPGIGLAVEQTFNKVGVIFGAQAVGAGGGESAARIAHHARTQLQQVLV